MVREIFELCFVYNDENSSLNREEFGEFFSKHSINREEFCASGGREKKVGGREKKVGWREFMVLP